MPTNGSGNGRAPAINGRPYLRAMMSGEADEDTLRMLRQIDSKVPPRRSGEMLLHWDRHSRLAQSGLLPLTPAGVQQTDAVELLRQDQNR